MDFQIGDSVIYKSPVKLGSPMAKVCVTAKSEDGQFFNGVVVWGGAADFFTMPSFITDARVSDVIDVIKGDISARNQL